MNTVSWRADPHRTVDRIATPDELLRWTRAGGLFDAATAEGGERALSAVRGLREAVHGLLAARVTAVRPSRRDVDAVRRATIDAWRHATADALPLRWTITPHDLRDVARMLALEAEDLLTSEPLLAALRRCGGTGCGWFFIDTSRSRTRRWCSGADCGNRERARRHYARHRATALAGSGTGSTDSAMTAGR